MREPIRDKERLLHIKEAIDFVIDNTKNVVYNNFINNKLLYGAVIYYTMIIGEASYKLSKEFKEIHNDTQQKDIEEMRHHLVHGYYQIDSFILWNIITNDIPLLQKQIEKYLNETNWSQWENN